MLDDRFGERARRVVRAGAAPVGAGGDIDAASVVTTSGPRSCLRGSGQRRAGYAAASRLSWPQAMRSLCSSSRPPSSSARLRAETERPVSSFRNSIELVLSLARASASSVASGISGSLFSVPRGPGRARGAHGGVVEQTLVDVADLLDVERAERKAPRFCGPAARDFDPQTCSASSRCRTTRLLIGSGSAACVCQMMCRRAAFEERIAVGIEQRAAVGRQPQGLVLDAAVDGAEGGEQASPGIVAALQHLFAMLVGDFLQAAPAAWRRRSSGRKAARREQQAALFGGEEKDEPHHHGERAVVETVSGNAFEQGASAFCVERSKACTSTSTAWRTW